MKYHKPKYSRMIGALSDIDDADQHFNGADFLVIVGGEGDVTVGGEIAVRNYMTYPMGEGTVRLMPGEFHGQPIKNGTTLHVKAGDWVYVPPYAPHLYSAVGNAGLVYTIVKLGAEPLGVVPNDLVVLEGTAVQQDAEQRLVWREVMGGSGTVDAGGQLQAATPLVEGGKHVWGEMRGTAVTGGETFTLKAGDWLSIPPQTPAQFKADAAGGLTYLVMKVPADIFPWDLIR